jgi:hypothetical protein
LLGPLGLQTGDKVLALNQCQVKDHDTWYQCIQSAANHANPGYCVSAELVREQDESTAGKEITWVSQMKTIIFSFYFNLLNESSTQLYHVSACLRHPGQLK